MAEPPGLLLAELNGSIQPPSIRSVYTATVASLSLCAKAKSENVPRTQLDRQTDLRKVKPVISNWNLCEPHK